MKLNFVKDIYIYNQLLFIKSRLHCMLAGLTFFRINRDIVGSIKPKHALRENIVRQSIKTFGRRMSFQKDSFLGVEPVSIEEGETALFSAA